ncbi:MAG: hypothetical protein J7621_00185 [Niastella sp.]|nr:hypothetical protein [Niastella sp.]
MKIFRITNKLEIVRGNKSTEPKYRKEISDLILDRFGRGPFTSDTVKEILIFCQNYYINAFEQVCVNESSYTFYKMIFRWHEQSVEIRQSNHFHNLPEGLDKGYFSCYRRILKMVLEQGCLVDMLSGEKEDLIFRKRIEPIVDDLLYLGEMIYRFGESIAEQDMVEDISDITFDLDNLYIQQRRHHYESIFKYIVTETEKSKDEFVIDKNASEDFKIALQGSFGIEYDKMLELLRMLFIHFNLKPGECLSAYSEHFIKDAINHTSVVESNLKNFLAGLTLNRDNKMPISELVRRPHSISRYLYRPLLQWTVDRKAFYMIGLFIWNEAENNLLLNAIPWGKYPVEWERDKNIKKYVNRKKDEHDKWLDDAVEDILIGERLQFDRGVKKLVTVKKSYTLMKKGVGEIDFIIICPAIKKILVTECKHLLGRYDMVNWKNDYDHFIGDGKNEGYNARIRGKVDWISQHKEVLEEHFKLKYKATTLSLKEFTIEGIFVINTPTFYMYNSVFRIYTFHRLKEVITGEYTDPKFSMWVDGGDYTTTYFIKYPYCKNQECYIMITRMIIAK